MKKFIRTLDLTPTWESLLPIFFDQIENGNEAQKKIAKEELTRLARAMDMNNAVKKVKK